MPGGSVPAGTADKEGEGLAGTGPSEPEPGAGVVTPTAAEGSALTGSIAGAVTSSPVEMCALSTLPKPAPQRLQFNACSELSARQRGQIIIRHQQC